MIIAIIIIIIIITIIIIIISVIIIITFMCTLYWSQKIFPVPFIAVCERSEKTKIEKYLKLTKILSWSVLSDKLFHNSQHSPNPWLLLHVVLNLI